jgi:hypothetical protein
MTAPGQPGYPGPAYTPRSPWYISRLLLFIAALCFFFAALTVGGANIMDAAAWSWGFGGFCAWALAWAAP